MQHIRRARGYSSAYHASREREKNEMEGRSMFQMALRRRRDNVGSQSVIGSATEDFTLGDLTLEGRRRTQQRRVAADR